MQDVSAIAPGPNMHNLPPFDHRTAVDHVALAGHVDSSLKGF